MATQLISYSLQSSFCLLLFYLFYRLLLRDQPAHHFNRLYLLLAPLAASGLPLVARDLNFAPATRLSPALQAIQLPEVVVTANAPSGGGFATIVVNTGFPELLVGFYAVVAALLLGRLCLQVLLIRKMAAEANPMPCQPPHVQVLQAEEDYPTFAFLNYVFLNHPPHLTPEERQQVLDHELAHVQLRHTFDVLFYELFALLFWFNPAAWLLRAALQDVHEFQADARTLQKHQPRQYSTLLAKSALYANGIFTGSSFSRHQVLRRLQMLQHAGEGGSMLRLVLVVPLLGLLMLFLSAQQVSADLNAALSFRQPTAAAIPAVSYEMQIRGQDKRKPASELQTIRGKEDEMVAELPASAVPAPPVTSSSVFTREHAAVAPPSTPVSYVATVITSRQKQTKRPVPEQLIKVAVSAEQEEDVPYTFSEQMPRFEGGEFAMFDFISQNLKYPEAAVQNRIQGLVFLTFIVRKDGSITDIDVLRGLGAGTDEEAIRVIQLMEGKWEPGMQNGRAVSVRYNLPIKFTLNQRK